MEIFIKEALQMKTGFLLLAGLLVVSILPCQAKSKAPLFADPSFNSTLIDKIDIFVVDTSHDDQENTKECLDGASFGGPNGGGAVISLFQRGYNLNGRSGDTRFYEAQLVPTEATLSNPTKQWLEDLGNQRRVYKLGTFWTLKKRERTYTLEQVPTSRWIMIITIEEVGSRVSAVKGFGKASLSIYLYDRNQATLLWHDHAEKNIWGGLLGNVVHKGANKAQGCAELTQSMIVKLPKHKKR
jgi:hypothetical protein